jgi:hypothetical protein
MFGLSHPVKDLNQREDTRAGDKVDEQFTAVRQCSSHAFANAVLCAFHW